MEISEFKDVTQPFTAKKEVTLQNVTPLYFVYLCVLCVPLSCFMQQDDEILAYFGMAARAL